MPIIHHNLSPYDPIVAQPMYPNALLIRGRVGYAYIFKQYGFHRVICKYSYPHGITSINQLRQRAKFAYGIFYWQGFPDGVKDYYNKMRYPVQMLGFNRYLRLYMLYG